MILRRIGAVLLGLVIAIAVVQIAEVGVRVISPPPPGMSMRNMETIKAYVAALPVSALLLVLAGWLIGIFLGTWAAAKVGRTAITAYIVGGVSIFLGIYNAVIFPQPMWYSIVLFAICIVATLIGAAMVRAGAAGKHA
jgi:hypothetical protein